MAMGIGVCLRETCNGVNGEAEAGTEIVKIIQYFLAFNSILLEISLETMYIMPAKRYTLALNENYRELSANLFGN